jgi:hypothetical protein
MDAHNLAPWRVPPLATAAVAALESDDRASIAAAAARLEQVGWLCPNSAALAALRSHLHLELDAVPMAVMEVWTATARRPWEPAYRKRLDALLASLGEGADGR